MILGWEDPLEKGKATHSGILAWRILSIPLLAWGFPGGSEGKASACNEGDPGLILGWEDPLEKEMATHSSILAWEISWTEEPDRLQSLGSQRAGDNLVTEHTCTGS